MKYKIYPLGENALTIDFGNEISIEKNEFAIHLANEIELDKFEGLIDCVPAYSSLTIFYNLFKVKKHTGSELSAFDKVKLFIENKIKYLPKTKTLLQRTVEVPISFDEEFAIDLDFVAKTNSLDNKEVIEIFLSKTYRVYMLGFLPGFAYMGEIDKRIATSRKQAPRTKVPKGSVGIAGTQTGIYPLESPGGWQIIGQTNLQLFNPDNENPTLFHPGDLVKFMV